MPYFFQNKLRKLFKDYFKSMLFYKQSNRLKMNLKWGLDCTCNPLRLGIHISDRV